MSTKFEREDPESNALSQTPQEHELLEDLHKQGIHDAQFYDIKGPTGTVYSPLVNHHGEFYPRPVKISND